MSVKRALEYFLLHICLRFPATWLVGCQEFQLTLLYHVKFATTRIFGKVQSFSKMSGDAGKSRGGQKKAGGSAASTAAKKNAANLKYANKKKSKENKKEQKLQKMTKSRCCPSWSTLFLLLVLTGVGMAAVKQYPDKIQELYDQLPPQVSRLL